MQLPPVSCILAFLEFDDKPTRDNLPLWPQLSNSRRQRISRPPNAVKKPYESSTAASTMVEVLAGAYHARKLQVTGLLTIENMTNRFVIKAIRPKRTSMTIDMATKMELLSQGKEASQPVAALCSTLSRNQATATATHGGRTAARRISTSSSPARLMVMLAKRVVTKMLSL